ncbi:hypothetical protein Fot_57778 [Forsythia ovata]|uniref:Uncharacterized protein n=1 Tax=Forsythia ovata TaxID=205694 RepID=A0ABD1NVZ0_9LAMI
MQVPSWNTAINLDEDDVCCLRRNEFSPIIFPPLYEYPHSLSPIPLPIELTSESEDEQLNPPLPRRIVAASKLDRRGLHNLREFFVFRLSLLDPKRRKMAKQARSRVSTNNDGFHMYMAPSLAVGIRCGKMKADNKGRYYQN